MSDVDALGLGGELMVDVLEAEQAAPEIETLDASSIRFSQSNVRRILPNIVDSMKANGWQGDPIDIVRKPDGD